MYYGKVTKVLEQGPYHLSFFSKETDERMNESE